MITDLSERCSTELTMVMKCIMNSCNMRGGSVGEERAETVETGYRMELDNARMTEMRC